MSYAVARKRAQNLEQEGRGTAQGIKSVNAGGGFLSNSVIQAKLQVGAVGTPAEKEADQVASQVMGGPSRLHEQDGPLTSGPAEGGELVQREAQEGGETGNFTVEGGLPEAMSASASHALDAQAGARIGGKLGADFSGVRVHTDRRAQQVAAGMSARAFTKGKDIYFNRGQYNPGTAAGQELLAHELTHTIQQGQVSQSGGIPVRQSASAQTAQRGFFSVRKHFRKAVDERNQNYEDYKKQSKWTRFKWAVSNPLAWAFGRTKANQKKTQERKERQELLDELDVDAMLDDNGGKASESANTGTGSKSPVKGGVPTPFTQAAALENAARGQSGGQSESQSKGQEPAKTPEPLNAEERAFQDREDFRKGALGTNIAGLAMSSGVSTGLDMLREWTGKGGMGETLDGLIPILGEGKLGSAAGTVNETFKDTFGNAGISEALNMAGSMSDFAGGGLGVLSNALALRNSVEESREMSRGGDKLAAAAAGMDAVGDTVKILKNSMYLARGGAKLAGNLGVAKGIGTAIPGVNIATGGAKIASSGIEMARTAKVKNRTKEAMEDYQAALDNDNLSPEERKRLKAQAGFMRMGHNTARADQTRAGFKMAEGIFETAGGVSSVIPGGSGVGTALSLIGTGVGMVGDAVADSKARKLRNEELNTTFNLESEIRKMKANVKARRGIELTDKEAKHLVLKKHGYLSRSEAYLDLAKSREAMLGDVGEEERDKMVGALGLDPKKATKSLVLRRLGVSKEDAANIDRAIQKKRDKKTLPTWHR